MTLPAILISLVLERLWGALPGLRRFDLFLDYARALRARLAPLVGENAFGMLLVLAPLPLLAALIQAGLGEGLWGLPGLIFGVAVLLYCLGPGDLDAELDAYREACAEGDEARIREQARKLLDRDPQEEPGARERALAEAILVQANLRLFAVLFWFVLLGPLGAVLYRCAALLGREAGAGEALFDVAARRLHAILVWIPARLTAGGYALSGDFEGAVSAWRHRAGEHPEDLSDLSEGVLVDAGNGALGLEPDAPPPEDWRALQHAAMGLVWRTLVLWVFVIALFTLAGWAA